MLVFQQQRHVIEHGDQWRSVRASRKAFEELVDDTLPTVPGAARTSASRRLLLAALLGMVNHTAQWYRPRGALSGAAIADGYLELVGAR